VSLLCGIGASTIAAACGMPSPMTSTSTTVSTPPPAPKRTSTPASGSTRPTISKPTVPVFVGQTSRVPQTTTSNGRSNCGGVTFYKSDGTPWVCTFDDEFDGTTLNARLWTVVRTAANGYRSGDACFVDSPRTVSMSGGTLNLTAYRTASPFVCSSPEGSFATQYVSGSVTTDRRFSQAYGYFEIKARFPDVRVAGLQSSLWLWPDHRDAYGSVFPDSGEIDIAEWFSSDPALAIPTIHYNPSGGPGADPDATTSNCSVANPARFNTYGLIWTAASIVVQIDGQTCLVDDWVPASPETKPEPFNLPFFINLTEALGVGVNSPTAATPLPATMQIDWVRVWR
jgi:beta-glucanase (GH16 family)